MPKSRMFITVSETEKDVWPPATREGGLGCRRDLAATKAQDAPPSAAELLRSRPPAQVEGRVNPTLLHA